MPIRGERHNGPELIPVIIKGQRVVLSGPPEPYDLDMAQKEVDGIRRTLDSGENLDDRISQHTLDQLARLVHDADQVIAASRQELDRIRTAQAALRSPEASRKYDNAINHLSMVIDRHVRMRSRIQDALERARTAFFKWEQEKRAAAQAKAPPG